MDQGRSTYARVQRLLWAKTARLIPVSNMRVYCTLHADSRTNFGPVLDLFRPKEMAKLRLLAIWIDQI